MSYNEYGTPILTGRPVGRGTRSVGLDLSELVDEPWMGEAVCAQTDPEEFFPEHGGSTKVAKSICRGCPVITECLEYAMAHNERHGVWGGMSERERRQLQWDREGGKRREVTWSCRRPA